jgi:RNA polymerase sigma factor (sigma-70 family)
VTLLQDDREFLAAFREGKRDALERVYRQYVRAVDNHVRALARATGNQEMTQRGAVADLVQEVFVRAFTASARRAYDGLRDFGPYLMTVARNCFVDTLRARGREVLRNVEELVDALDGSVEEPQPTCDPKTQAVVTQYLRDLPDPLRAVYEQRFVLGNSQEESAAAVGLSRRSFRTAEDRLRRGLRKALVRAGISLRELDGSREDFSTRPAVPAVLSRSRS